MELIFEIIFDIIFEGAFELGTEKKVPTPVRILAMFVFGFLYGVVLVAIFMVALLVMKNTSVLLGWFFIAVDVLCVVALVYAVRKKKH